MSEMNEASITDSQTTDTPTTPDSDIKAGISIDKEFTALYKHFGVEPSPRTDEALQEIWNYAKEQSPSQDKDSVILQVIRFNNELGGVAIGESPYSKMYNYLTVYRQFKKAGKLMEEMKKA